MTDRALSVAGASGRIAEFERLGQLTGIDHAQLV